MDEPLFRKCDFIRHKKYNSVYVIMDIDAEDYRVMCLSTGSEYDVHRCEEYFVYRHHAELYYDLYVLPYNKFWNELNAY